MSSDDQLTVNQAAALAGLKPSTWRAYVSRGIAPPPDDRLGDQTPWWWRSTVLAWIESRPGRGYRSDLKNNPPNQGESQSQ